MTPFEAFLYGAIQGITEYLPISSSAHLVLLPRFMGAEDPGLTFDVFLHLGTLMATLVYFRKDWMSILGALFGKKNSLSPPTVSWLHIVVATVPALVAGALLHKWVGSVFRENIVLIVALMAGGVGLVLSDRFCSSDRSLQTLNLKQGFWVGVMQCLALVPGVSRSGATMMGGRLVGLSRESSARFSFLLSAPVTGAALVFEARHWKELLQSTAGWGALTVAGLSSFICGMLAIAGLLKMSQKFGYLSFAIYRVLLAASIYFLL